jgi:MFS family permease
VLDDPRSGAFEALRSAPFRRYYGANALASAAQALQMTIFGFIVFEKTESNFLLGLFSFMQMAPSLVLAPLVGVVVDSIERRRILAAIFLVQSTGFLTLAVFEFSGALTVPAIGVTVVLMGVAMAFTFPASASLVPSLIPRRALQSAIAANSLLMNVSRIAAPALAGLAIAALGVGLVLVSGAALYLPAAFVMLSIPLAAVAQASSPAPPAMRGPERFFGDLRDVIIYIRGNRMLRASLFNDVVPFGFGMAYTALLPALALDVLDGDAGTLGLLHGLGGAGALAGTLVGAWVAGRIRRGLIIWTGMLGWGAALALLAASPSYLVVVPALALTGLFQTLYIVQNDTLIQVFAEDRYRGRVIAAQSMINALRTLGFLLIGTLAAATSVPFAIGAFGLVVAGMGFVTLLFRPEMRNLR